MSLISSSFRAFAQVALVLIALILSSCSYQGLPELTLKQIDLTEWPAHAYSDERLVLLVELIETGRSRSYPDAPYVWSGFCGERPRFTAIGLGGLYIERLSGAHVSYGKSSVNPGTESSMPLFAIINLKRPQGLADSPDIFPDYDLRDDHRDICLGTSVPSMFSVSLSNTVRVPRDVIARALREGVRPLPDLIPFLEAFHRPTFTIVAPR